MEKNALQMDFDMALIGINETGAYQDRLKEARERLWSGGEPFTGWVGLPETYDRQEIERIKSAAEEIRNTCQALVVIGIGGSYLGTRAAVEMLCPGKAAGCLAGKPSAQGSSPALYFAGQNMSGTYHAELLEILEEQETCLCVISKSGTTIESSIAFGLFRDALIRKYGKEEAGKRIYTVTDREKGVLREEADREGYTSFAVPSDIGGRYSVLTPVGLLPIAAAGIDIDEMLSGARTARVSASLMETAGLYASVRNILYKKGKLIEIFETYEPRLQFFTEWLKQLFGESEGKEGKGIFPAALQLTTDLHSMGQFLQEGNQIFFETVLNVKKPSKDLKIPGTAGDLLGGRSMNDVNQAAMQGVAQAHCKAGVPVLRLDLPDLSAYTFGQLVYFFETACALSGYLLGVDPFDQPGVESYKAEMRKILKNAF